jgi:NADH:ubiquinone oxidoreductase subunit 4 (subunit M)
MARLVALIATSAAFVVSIAFYMGFDPNTSILAPQFLERVALLSGADVSYTLGIDGINLLLVISEHTTPLFSYSWQE